ncbi:No66 [Symbiodinium sp. CCMP2456]|nr:No66 [Symbiodinium sp. CCMP2456]
MLVTTTSLQLGALDASMVSFVATFSKVILSLLGCAMLLLLLGTSSALFYRGALGGQREIYLFNLQKVPSAISMSGKLKIIATELASMHTEDVCQSIETMSVVDLNLLLASMSLLAMEVVPQVQEQMSFHRRSSLRMTSRISTNSFAVKPLSQAERMAKIQSLRSQRSSGNSAASVPVRAEVPCLAVQLHEASFQACGKQDDGLYKKPVGNEVVHMYI